MSKHNDPHKQLQIPIQHPIMIPTPISYFRFCFKYFLIPKFLETIFKKVKNL